MDAVGRVGSCWHHLTLVVISGLDPQWQMTKSADKSFLLSPVLGFGAVCNVSVVLQAPSLPVLNSPVVSVPGLMFLE